MTIFFAVATVTGMNSKSRLNVVAVEKKPSLPPTAISKKSLSSRAQEAQAQFERLWLRHPEKFNPLRNCKEKERIARTWELIKSSLNLHGIRCTDLGCGSGEIALRLSHAGASVDAVDIAHNALKHLAKKQLNEHIQLVQSALPSTSLEDGTYDLVVCADVIAELHPYDYRLCFSELSRLLKPTGYLVCSTPIDISSEDALKRFLTLAETEFEIHKLILSHHRLYIRLCDFFEAPKRFAKAWRDRSYRTEQLVKRKSLARWWFQGNSSPLLGPLWFLIQYLTKPIAHSLKKARLLMLTLEKLCAILTPDSSISHAIFLGKRRPLFSSEPLRNNPRKEPKWE